MKIFRAINAFVTGIGWTDLGAAFAMIVAGRLFLDVGYLWCGILCWVYGITVYCAAPRQK